MVDAQNITNIQDKIIDAVETIVDKKMKDDSRDRTIKATVLSCKNPLIGEYNIQYGTNFFTAFGDKAYSDKSQVYVLIPENDYSKKIFILGSVEEENNLMNSINATSTLKGYHILDSSIIDTGNIVFSISENSYNYIYKYDEAAAIEADKKYITDAESKLTVSIGQIDSSNSSWTIPTISEWFSEDITDERKKELILTYNNNINFSQEEEDILNLIKNIEDYKEMKEKTKEYNDKYSSLFYLIISATLNDLSLTEINTILETEEISIKDNPDLDDNNNNDIDIPLTSYSNIYSSINKKFINNSNSYSLSKATSLYISADFKNDLNTLDGTAGIIILLDYKQGNNIVTIPYYLNMNSFVNSNVVINNEYITYDTVVKMTENIDFVRINSIIYYSENYTNPSIKIKNIKIYPLSSIDDNDEYTINLSAERGSLLDPVTKTSTFFSAKSYYNDIDITNKTIFYWGIESCEEDMVYNTILGGNYSFLGTGIEQNITINDVKSKSARIICVATYNGMVVGKEYINVYSSRYCHIVALRSIVDGDDITLNCTIDGRIYNDLDATNEQGDRDEAKDTEVYETYNTRLMVSDNINNVLDQNNYTPFIFVSSNEDVDGNNPIGKKDYYFISNSLNSINSDCETYGSSYNDYWKYTFRPVMYSGSLSKVNNSVKDKYLDKNGYVLQEKAPARKLTYEYIDDKDKKHNYDFDGTDIENFNTRKYQVYGYIGTSDASKLDSWTNVPSSVKKFFKEAFHPMRIQVVGSHYRYDTTGQELIDTSFDNDIDDEVKVDGDGNNIENTE